ncbi:hypothetical protein QP027_11445 [Corynebacterium breve]|uniref:Secreted protein n=1 Tax=Corynebacterium breve TaxID=3049799 RepID=A0ABY8VDX9_9CORY|nr:hypothetical protein [Corynebacterium breve]WIM67679.1 hypothetical protein QP027_11445 [Corynebacterium breve]
MTGQTPLRRQWRRVAAASLAIAGLAGASSFPAAALPVPTDPTNPTIHDQWVNTAIRPDDGQQKITVSLIDAPSAITEGDDFKATLAIKNDSKKDVDGLTITPRRGPISASVADSRVAAVAEPHEYTEVGDQVVVDKRIKAGETYNVEVTVPTDVTQPGAITMPAPAVYPWMFVLAGSNGEHLDSERFHLAAENDAPAEQQAPQVTMLYPITAQTDILPGETGEAPERPPLMLSTESLAGELEDGGRLDELIDTYLDATTGTSGEAITQSTCLALDPALIDTVERMTKGYSVAKARESVVRKPQRLRDSWTENDSDIESAPGSGEQDAAAWLEKVQSAAQSGCTVALPWSNADVNGVARTGAPWLMRESISRGQYTLEQILGAESMSNVVIPPSGYVTADTAPAMGWADRSVSGATTKGGLSAAWEQQHPIGVEPNANGTTAGQKAQETNLERTGAPSPQMAAAPTPAEPVHILVSSNTLGQVAPTDDTQGQRFANIGPGLTAVTFQDSLASTLAATGDHPITTGYSNPGFRYDYALDSTAARDITAASAVRLAVGESTTAPGETAGQPVMINPPSTWEAGTAEEILSVVGTLFDDNSAEPLSLADYITLPADVTATTAGELGTPFSDPTVFSDSEVLSAGQQARYADDLTSLLAPDPSIALTRYGFSLPLRRDLITALSLNGRRSADTYNDVASHSSEVLNSTRDTLNELRAAISLIPPGNVYTRTSPSSPLLIVAENGLPLPVDATILYEAPDGTELHTPETMRIPARGSITIQMTATLPDDRERTDLKLYLATPNGQPISHPVNISVQTAAGEVGALVVGGALAVFLVLAVLFRTGKMRGRNRREAMRDDSPQAPSSNALDRPPDR